MERLYFLLKNINRNTLERQGKLAALELARMARHANISEDDYNVLVSHTANKIYTFIRNALSTSGGFSEVEWSKLLEEINMRPESVTNPVKDLGYLGPLHYLISISKNQIARQLLEGLIDIDSVDLSNSTNISIISPLALCVKSEELIFAGRLLEKGCRIDSVDISGETPFIKAIRLHRKGFVSLLLEYQADINKVTEDVYKVTALFFAVLNKDRDLVSKLINHGALDHESEIGSAAEIAVISGDLNTLEILAGYGFTIPDVLNYQPPESLLKFIKFHNTSFEYDGLNHEVVDFLRSINEYDKFIENDGLNIKAHVEKLNEIKSENPVLALRIMKKVFGGQKSNFQNLEEHIEALNDPNIALVAYASILAGNKEKTPDEILEKLGIAFPDEYWMFPDIKELGAEGILGENPADSGFYFI